MRWKDREIKSVRSQQKVLLATDMSSLPQSLVSHTHVSMAVDWEDEEGVLAAARLPWVCVKSHIMFPCHVTKRSQPGCHGDVLVHVELEIVCRPDQSLYEGLGDDVTSAVSKSEELAAEEPVRLPVFARPALLGVSVGLKVAPVEAGGRGVMRLQAVEDLVQPDVVPACRNGIIRCISNTSYVELSS